MASSKILLSHGSGGRLTHELIKEIFAKRFSNPVLDEMDDSAEVKAEGLRLAFTTDSYVVNPLEFPGGDIGKISVCGTVNDLAMKGARPLALAAAFIMEEGLDKSILEKMTDSMRAAAEEAGVWIVTGDTKVVPKGAADKLFITTSGIGLIDKNINLSGKNAKPGDVVLVSGEIGAHGIAVLNARNKLGLQGGIESDAAPLNHLVSEMLRACGKIHVLRDLTRGGLATALNEIASSSACLVEIDEAEVPVSGPVSAACGLLGLDPFYSANEGRLAAILPGAEAEKVLTAMRKNKYGKKSRLIGRVIEGPGKVRLLTRVGGSRTLLMLEGDQFPRIC